MRVYHDFFLLPGSRSTFPDTDPDPDPTKWYGSDRIRIRIRIRNTAPNNLVTIDGPFLALQKKH